MTSVSVYVPSTGGGAMAPMAPP